MSDYHTGQSLFSKQTRPGEKTSRYTSLTKKSSDGVWLDKIPGTAVQWLVATPFLAAIMGVLFQYSSGLMSEVVLPLVVIITLFMAVLKGTRSKKNGPSLTVDEVAVKPYAKLATLLLKEPKAEQTVSWISHKMGLSEESVVKLLAWLHKKGVLVEELNEHNGEWYYWIPDASQLALQDSLENRIKQLES